MTVIHASTNIFSGTIIGTFEIILNNKQDPEDEDDEQEDWDKIGNNVS